MLSFATFLRHFYDIFCTALFCNFTIGALVLKTMLLSFTRASFMYAARYKLNNLFQKSVSSLSGFMPLLYFDLLLCFDICDLVNDMVTRLTVIHWPNKKLQNLFLDMTDAREIGNGNIQIIRNDFQILSSVNAMYSLYIVH